MNEVMQFLTAVDAQIYIYIYINIYISIVIVRLVMNGAESNKATCDIRHFNIEQPLKPLKVYVHVHAYNRMNERMNGLFTGPVWPRHDQK